jgi:hypothetical protein
MDLNAACLALLEKTDDELFEIAKVARIRNFKSLGRLDLIDSIINCL